MRVAVGRIGRPHGIRGEVVVHVSTDEPERRFVPGSALTASQDPARDPDPDGNDALTVASARWQSGRLVVAFDGIADRTAAEGLRGAWLTVDSAEVSSGGDPDEFYDHELIGLDVVTVDGTRVGTVTDVLHHGQDRLVVRREQDTDEIFVPFVREIVPEVDPRGGRLVIDPPPGLLDPGEAMEA